jgi:hypothetical protein
MTHHQPDGSQTQSPAGGGPQSGLVGVDAIRIMYRQHVNVILWVNSVYLYGDIALVVCWVVVEPMKDFCTGESQFHCLLVSLVIRLTILRDKSGLRHLGA